MSKSDEPARFRAEVSANIAALANDGDLHALSRIWVREAALYKYSYNFSWMGRPIIQFPQDMIAMQEIVWNVRPELIIETGVAHGGSTVYYASLLHLIGEGEVIGIDIDIRAHNREFIENHPMKPRIHLIEGSSIDQSTIDNVYELARGKRAIVVLDSHHTHDHVLAELDAYAPLVCDGGYCIVMDTSIEFMPADFSSGRPWGKGDNPLTAVEEYLGSHPEFVVDSDISNKLLITDAPGGYLRRIGNA